jgi:zinc protease
MSISPVWKSLPGTHDIVRSVLPNGITILARANFDSPSVIISGLIPSGSLFDPADRLGLAYFTSQALMRGTQKHSHQELFEALESAGAVFGFGCSVHNASFSGRALAEDLPLLLDTLNEALRQPTFPIDQVEKLRAQMMTYLAIRAQNTDEVASLRFDDVLFPGHPYGRPEEGHPETVRVITQQELVDFHRKAYGAEGMILAIVGAVQPNEAIDRVGEMLGDWSNPNQYQLPSLPPTSPLEKNHRQHITLPGKTQADLVMGTLGPSRNSPDYLIASIGNNVLGQFGLMGRIGEVVREKAGLAYYASTNLNAWIASGSWEVSAGVNPANLEHAIDLIITELRRFVSEPVTTEELSDSQSNYIGRLPISLESNAGVANAILNLERFQLGLDYYLHYPDLVAAVTPQQILDIAQKYICPDRLAIISAGPEIVT